MAFAWLHSASGKAEVIPIPQAVQAAGAAAALAWIRAEKSKRFTSPGAGRSEEETAQVSTPGESSGQA